jgi:hypothetical protein
MKTSLARSLTTLTAVAAFGVLATACAASTDASSEPSEQSASASTIGCQNAPPETRQTFANQCQSNFTGSGATSYAGDECAAFTTEWDATTQNASGLFRVNVEPTWQTPFTATSCAETTLTYTVYGLQDVLNGLRSTFTWIQIGNQYVAKGQWNGVQCYFPTTVFSDAVQGYTQPNELPRYQDIKVVTQLAMGGIRNVHLSPYLPVQLSLDPASCD